VLHQIRDLVAARSFARYRVTAHHGARDVTADPGGRAGAVRHVEERFRVADEFVDVPLAGDLLHYAFLVVISQ